LSQDLRLAEIAASEVMKYPRDPETQRPLTIHRVAAMNGEPTRRDVAILLQSRYVQASAAGQDVDAINISAQSTNPGEAALLANLYAQAYVDIAQASSRSGVTASREFLEEQVSGRGDRLEELDAAVESFMNREGAVALDEETTNIINQLGSLEAQLDGVSLEAEMKEATIAATQSQLSDLRASQPRVTANTSTAELESARRELVQIESSLSRIYMVNPELEGSGNLPEDVQRMEQRRSQLRATIESAASQTVADGATRAPEATAEQVETLEAQLANDRIRLNGLRAQRRQLRQRIGELEGEMSRIPSQSIELAQLQRERAAADQTFSSLEQKLTEAQIAEESELGYAEVIRPAFVPSIPFAPKRGRNVILAVFLGLTFGIVFAVARVRLDHRLFRPDDLQNLGYALIGTIPDTDGLIKKDFGGKGFITVDGKEVDSHLITLLNPMATASETYRALRTSVQFSRPDAMIETILVTSPNPGEGKSVTAANLAVVIAQSGRTVLLVDSDLRRPTVHRKFGLSREPGLVQRLFDDRRLSFADFEQPADDLYVLPAGSLAPNPSELLGSKRMRDLMDELNELFDVVIFDAPPVLAATDAVLLSTQTDATLVVVRSGRTRDYELESAMDALNNVGAKVIGTVLNGFHISKAYGYRYKYAYRYGRDYAYGYGQKKT
ncbi:MAG: polysaccharide biosynthesis tyrosine autokinase, partial [Bacteroidota bacterium]